MPETRQSRIEHALELLDREVTYASDERSAFERFRSRVRTLDPTSPRHPGVRAGGGGVVALETAAPPDAAARTVRQAYDETVLSVPHFEAEYGETLRQNFEAELGTEVAVQVFETGRVTRPVHDALLAATEQAIEERTTYLETLRTERDSLCRARDRLDDCESRAAELGARLTTADSPDRSGIDDQLQSLEAVCEDVTQTRQELLHGRSTAQLVGISGETLVQFLYAECTATCPVLADAADCIETIRHQRRRSLTLPAVTS